VGAGGGRAGGGEALLRTFTECWQASKSSSVCKKAGVRFIGQRLRRWWPLSIQPPAKEWVAGA